MACEVSTTLVKDADNLVTLICLTDTTDGSIITTATVDVRMTDLSDVDIAGTAWPISMPHVDKGTYQGSVPDTLVVTVGQQVKVIITADDGPGRRRIFNTTVTVEEG